MLNSDTYTRLNHAGVPMPENEAGANHAVKGITTGSDNTRAQQMTCQPPSVLEIFAPSA
jgi:hypothetical protein